jgi:hypothetical protein
MAPLVFGKVNDQPLSAGDGPAGMLLLYWKTQAEAAMLSWAGWGSSGVVKLVTGDEVRRIAVNIVVGIWMVQICRHSYAENCAACNRDAYNASNPFWTGMQDNLS